MRDSAAHVFGDQILVNEVVEENGHPFRTPRAEALGSLAGIQRRRAQTTSDLPDRLTESIFIFDQRHPNIPFTSRPKTTTRADRHVAGFE